MSTITRLAKTAGKTPIKNTKVKNIKKRTTRNSSKTRKVEIYTDGDEQDEQQYEDCQPREEFSQYLSEILSNYQNLSS